MKRIFLPFLVVCILLTFTPKTFAEIDLKNNYKGYVIENHKYEEVEAALQKELSPVLTKTSPLKTVKHAYLDTTNNNNHCYIRFYPANQDTNIYIVSDKKFNFNQNILTQTFDKLSYSYSMLTSKEALKEYKFDFIDLARAGEFQGFFIIPDYIKPLKTTVNKINNYVGLRTKKKALKPYSNDKNEIRLTLLDTKEYNNPNKNLKIISKEYRLKQKENKYVHAFEYVICNNSPNAIILKETTGESIAYLRDIEVAALSDLDKLNLLDTLGSFPPVLILSAGASLGLKVPNYIRVIKMTKEAKRYTKELPQNQSIAPNSTLRILTMKFKTNPQPVNFKFEKDSEVFNVSF